MDTNIKHFIEKYIELLDTNPTEFFVKSYIESMPREDVGYMSVLLSDAGIDSNEITEWRHNALYQIIDTQISTWYSSTGGVSAMPLYDFISAFLDNCIGFSENYVLLFMLKNTHRWTHWVTFTKDTTRNLTIIERNQ